VSSAGIIDAARRILAAILELLRRAADAVLAAWRERQLPPDAEAAWTVSAWWESTVRAVAPPQSGDGDQLRLALLVAVADQVRRYHLALDAARAAGSDPGQAVLDATAAAEARWRVFVERWARTEQTRARAMAALDSAAAKRPGARKRWLTEKDERVRRTHNLVDGDTLPVNVPFLVGGYPMMHPGDPLGPPDEVLNCRCDLEIVGA